MFAAGALAGAACTAAMAQWAHGLAAAIPLRLLTGVSLALVYPVGMKIMATWTVKDRGLGLGLLVGALTLGSATPHLVRGLDGIAQWRPVLVIVAALAAAGGLLVWRAVGLGPHHVAARRIDWRMMGAAWRDRGVRLANFGYLGHMWELYAMWTWAPAFLLASYRAHGVAAPERSAAIAAFAVIAAGGLGSLAAGWLADRWGRTRTTIVSLVASGLCALGIGLLFGAPEAATLVALVWGFAVVADSAQFSSAVSELADAAYVGTALATQTATGFLLTMVSIQLTPVVTAAVGWSRTFPFLAIGPALGAVAMWRLKNSVMAGQLAGGRG